MLVTPMSTPGVGQPLDELSETGVQVLHTVKHAGDLAESTAKLVRDLLDALGTAGTALRHRDAAMSPLEAARFSEWLHELRGRMHAIVGWAHLLRRARNDTLRLRAFEAIERNARRFDALLAEPPE